MPQKAVVPETWLNAWKHRQAKQERQRDPVMAWPKMPSAAKRRKAGITRCTTKRIETTQKRRITLERTIFSIQERLSDSARENLQESRISPRFRKRNKRRRRPRSTLNLNRISCSAGIFTKGSIGQMLAGIKGIEQYLSV